MQKSEQLSSPVRGRLAFTLVELLVVIGIIALLISMLMPALSRARQQAMTVQCLSNLRQIGMSVFSYTNDNKGSFPTHTNWGNVVGKMGKDNRYDEAGGLTGFINEAGVLYERPLNKYLGTPEVCRCPADIGDAYWPDVDNCYEYFGTSYLVQWQSSVFAVHYVTTVPPPAGNPSAPRPMKQGGMKESSRKIVMGDWNWHANRPVDLPRTVWHRNGTKFQRNFNMLFADGHVESYLFPIEYEQAPINVSYGYDDNSGAGLAPNPSRGFW